MIKRTVAECKPYVAPGHFDVSVLRLSGQDETGATKYWVGMSHFLPGGGCEPGTTPHEKFYYVVSGELVVFDEKGTRYELKATDSIFIKGGEIRSIKNESNFPCTTLVVYNY
jgi:quercetin dioxygenase-like cupin family protein